MDADTTGLGSGATTGLGAGFFFVEPADPAGFFVVEPPDPELPEPPEDPLPPDDEPLPELWDEWLAEVLWEVEVWLALVDAPPVGFDVCFGFALERCSAGFLDDVDAVVVVCGAVLVVWLGALVTAERVVELDEEEPPQAATASAMSIAASSRAGPAIPLRRALMLRLRQRPSPARRPPVLPTGVSTGPVHDPRVR